jgi:hypothetical protein
MCKRSVGVYRVHYAVLVKNLVHRKCDTLFLTEVVSFGCCVVECKFCGRCYLDVGTEYLAAEFLVVIGFAKLVIACLLWWDAAGCSAARSQQLLGPQLREECPVAKAVAGKVKDKWERMRKEGNVR